MWEYFKKHQNLLTNASIFPCLSMAFLIVKKAHTCTHTHTHKKHILHGCCQFPDENNIYEYKRLFNFIFFALQTVFFPFLRKTS